MIKKENAARRMIVTEKTLSVNSMFIPPGLEITEIN